MPYITPRRFRLMGLGVDLSEKSDAELGVLLEIASSKAETHCQVPDGHSFFGGTITDEVRVWHTGNTHAQGQRRVWPLHRPIKDVTGLAIDITNGQYIDFQPDNLYIDRHLDVIEITSLQLTPASVFTTGLAPYIAIQKPRSRLSYTYGWDLTSAEVISVTTSAAEGTEFDLKNQFLTADAITVSKNETPLAEGDDYEIDRYEGVLTIIDGLARGDKVYVEYTYPLPTKIAQATALIGADIINWSSQMEAGLGGISNLKINEMSMSASKTNGFANVPVSNAADMLLKPYMYRGFAA